MCTLTPAWLPKNPPTASGASVFSVHDFAHIPISD